MPNLDPLNTFITRSVARTVIKCMVISRITLIRDFTYKFANHQHLSWANPGACIACLQNCLLCLLSLCLSIPQLSVPQIDSQREEHLSSYICGLSNTSSYALFIIFHQRLSKLNCSPSFNTIFPKLYEEYNIRFKMENDIKRDKIDLSQKHISSNKNKGKHLKVSKPK